MNTNNLKNTAKNLLSFAKIKINGPNPQDMQIHNENLYKNVLSQGNLGLGEAYMNKWWDCDRLDIFFDQILSAQLDKKIKHNKTLLLKALMAKIFNLQSTNRAFQIGEKHYDKGNKLYKNMLDQRLTYTCGYWKNAQNLDQAQEAKLDLTCRKLGLKPGQKILDIGCGWGSFVKFAAEKYGIQAVGVTVSKQQKILAEKLCQGLPIEIRLQDYRDVNEKFDHIVSLGMIEHVGHKNYQTYMKIAHRCLKNTGLFLLHTIGGNKSVTSNDQWISKYIFPNSMLPSIKQIAKSIERLFVLEDLHNFSADYDKTLISWYNNFKNNWHKIKNDYDERFYRMWKYYLLSCAGTFRSRKNQLWQIVLSKNGVKGGYTSIR